MNLSSTGFHALALTAMWCVGRVYAGTVTVEISSSGTVSAQDTIVVFDPLDTTVAPARTQATIDQVDKQFVPKISVLRTGTTVIFTNSDHIRHQVYSFSPSKTFTLKLYAGSPEAPVVFDKPGLVVLGCNIHDNMLAFVGIVDSPYFGKASKSGSVALNLPAGRYRLRVWHPSLRQPMPSREIAVSASAMTIPLTLDLTPNAPGVAPWPE
ncbi:MAG TPA: methylamine utilization protein [Steroidobacteraceae bacterium]|jgi:plastocyanin|nr:methylamine utilization protein [Steroidobacteraceae bacterium]